MARSKHPRRTRSFAAVACCCCCCLLSLLFIATAAAAKRDHAKAPAQSAPAEPSSPGSSGQAGGAPGETGAAPANGQPNAPAGGAPAAPPASHHDHHHGGSTPGHSDPHAPGAGAATPPAGAGEQPSGSEGGASSEASASEAPNASAQAKRKKETKETKPKKGSHEHKSKSKKGSGAEGEEERETGSGSGSESPGTATPTTPTVLTPTLASAAAVAPEAATAPPTAAVTPTAATSTSAAGASRAARAPRRTAARRRRAAKAPHTSIAAIAAAPATGIASSTRRAGGSHRAPAQRTSDSAHAAKHHSRPSPLVTTITKIVGVVPVAVRMLIAALLGLALLLAMRSRVAALRTRRLERQRVQLLEDVGLLQAALLPVPPARLGPVGTTAAYQPAAGPGAGGDFYDVFALANGQLAVILGDVSGHGRQALPHTALVRYTLRAYLEAGLSPREALQTAGEVLEHQLGGVFATVVLATYQPRERKLVYACAGHPPPVVLGAGVAAGAHPQALEPVTLAASPPIGVGMRTGTRQTVVAVPGHAQICFYTDGLTEARVGSELFGTQRLEQTLAELGPAATASALLQQVAAQADARPDDMAACLLDVAGGQHAPKLLVEEIELDSNEAANARTERFLHACGVEPHEVAETLRAARTAAGRSGTVLLEVQHSHDGPPQITLQREQVAYLHARRVDKEVAL